MDTDVLVLPAETDFDEFLSRPEHAGRMRHVIVTRNNRIFGVVRVNTGIRRGLAKVDTGITLGDVARPNFTIVREDDIAFEVIQRIWRKRAVMAIVVQSGWVPRPKNIAGVITKGTRRQLRSGQRADLSELAFRPIHTVHRTTRSNPPPYLIAKGCHAAPVSVSAAGGRGGGSRSPDSGS